MGFPTRAFGHTLIDIVAEVVMHDYEYIAENWRQYLQSRQIQYANVIASLGVNYALLDVYAKSLCIYIYTCLPLVLDPHCFYVFFCLSHHWSGLQIQETHLLLRSQ